ncbi:hypothetical protein M8C21_012178 [Ambrosia artemisiifolia]|uniref:Uncharacterized protein n=1 Tax=Ambrosia artemisiifolia TaxID=4212 RepID=A0AAD5G9I4_AMBAR|nr:hypothetical protein M8C21_012178 [Ambrosia artemisiifolia]
MVEDQRGGSRSKTGTNSRLDDRFLAGEEYAMKARKPYTITKQREKWTQEDHIRFLEALKLYGRSWRQIEEHMGNRTAVQIRSHAQKFFSKVVRESSQGTEGGPIEIPPPRAKRKPTHPYPRKVSVPLKQGTTCHGLFATNHDNTSPSLPKYVSTQSLKLFGKMVFVTGSTSPPCVDTLTTLPWNSMPSLVPECPKTRNLSGFRDLAYRVLQTSDRTKPTTQCGSQESENCEFGDKGERCTKGFVPYKRCLIEESSMLTSEEREELRVMLCL